jgi:hypothetical protein
LISVEVRTSFELTPVLALLFWHRGGVTLWETGMNEGEDGYALPRLIDSEHDHHQDLTAQTLRVLAIHA